MFPKVNVTWLTSRQPPRAPRRVAAVHCSPRSPIMVGAVPVAWITYSQRALSSQTAPPPTTRPLKKGRG